MAIDSPAKRKSLSAVAFVALIPGVTPDGSFGGTQKQAAGWSYIGIAADAPAVGPPLDDDADATYTAWTDVQDGATIRAPRVSFYHAADTLKTGDFGAPIRVAADDHDRYEGRFSLAGATGLEGRVHSFVFETGRAGDALAVRRFAVHHAPALDWTERASDTTTGTDADGAHVRPPQPQLTYAFDSALIAALSNPHTATIDRYRARYPLSGESRSQGRVFHLVLEALRAGEALGLAGLTVHHTLLPGTQRVRVPER